MTEEEVTLEKLKELADKEVGRRTKAGKADKENESSGRSRARGYKGAGGNK